MGGDIVAPSLRRRLGSFIYEGVLLFGVLMISAYLYSSLSQQRNAMQNRHGLQAFLFVVLGIYFVWFWSHGGQTLAMKTWRIRVVDRLGRPLTQGRALARYLLSWLWFMPALLFSYISNRPSAAAIFGALFLGAAIWALLSKLHPARQFMHDLLAGTRLMSSESRRG